MTASCSGRRNMRGFGLPGCGARRRRADLDEAETERGERVDVRAVLVETGGESDRIVEAQAEHVDRQRLRPRGEQRVEARAVRGFDRGEAEIVRALGVEAEQERAGEGVHQVSRRPR